MHLIIKMRLTKTQLRIIQLITKGTNTVSELALSLNKSKSQVYRSINNLKDKGIIINDKRKIELTSKFHVHLLSTNLIKHPNLTESLTNHSIEILQELIEPKTVDEIIKKVKLKPAMVYNIVRKLFKISILVRDKKRYSLNPKLWDSLKEFIIESKKYDETIDSRVRTSSTIYFKNNKEIVFSSTKEEDAIATGFSAYADYGIKILTTKNYYTLPKRKLSLKKVFEHSLFICKKEKSTRLLTFATLFYLKHKPSVSDEIVTKIKNVLKGEKITGYPGLEEIKEKAEQYGVKLK